MEPLDQSNHRSSGSLLGSLIKEKRQAAGLRQDELAHELDLSAAYMSHLERGDYRSPKPQVLMRIAKRLDVNLADLYAITGCMLPADLPDFSAYLHAKHPDWPEPVIDQLTSYYDFQKQTHGLI